MSNSRRKTPVCGMTTARSEKEDKQIYNRRFRRVLKAILTQFMDDTLLPLRNLMCPIWSYSKDGKQRFDPKKYPELMRK